MSFWAGLRAFRWRLAGGLTGQEPEKSATLFSGFTD